MLKARCYECHKLVSSVSARYIPDATAKKNLDKGTLNGERIYGKDCYAKLENKGAK